MVTKLNTAIRGDQIIDATISGAHIKNAEITPIKLDIVNSPDDGDVLTYNASNSAFEWEKVGTLTANESPTGSINGSNTNFTLSAAPEANSLEVYLNGILQQPGTGNDYTVSGTQITFTAAPEVGDIILCSYLTSAGLGGGYYTDHGNLNGLGDDDHLQYILVDGSRAFTNVISYNSNKSFTADTNLVDKKYVDDSVAGLSQDSITEGNSKVEVVDTGTGYIIIEADASEIARFNANSLQLSGDLLPEMTGASGSVSTRDIGSATAKFNTIYCHDLMADAGSIYVNNKKVIEDVSDVITISTDSGQRLKVASTGDSGDLYFSGEGGVQIVVPSTYSNHDITISNNSSGGDINIGGTGQTIKLNGTVDLANGDLDHSDLSGLSDDDHTQYIRVDGTRSFTGVVGGITPTSADHLATKSYVDSVVQGLDWQDSVIDKDLSSPPGSPSTGDRYLIANSATGAWSGHDGEITEWNGSSWEFTAKSEGLAVWVEDENKLYTYNGSAWVVFGSTISHNNTSGLNDGDYKHLTASEYNGLTGSGDTTLHTHDDRYFTETEADARFVLLTDYEDADVLAKIKNVDGSGSGLDADLLDGHDSSYFSINGHTHDSRYVNVTGDEMTGTLKISGTTKTDGYFYAGTTDPTNSTRLNYDGYFYATKVYNAVYNDIADFQPVDDEVVYGKVYRLTKSGAKICTERCQLGVIGVCSDTYGIAAGVGGDNKAPFAVAGWVLAYVDKEYEPGTPLTNDENGDLIEMTLEDKRSYPERLVAIYDRPEPREFWGPNNEIKVNGRHWIKVR